MSLFESIRQEELVRVGLEIRSRADRETAASGVRAGVGAGGPIGEFTSDLSSGLVRLAIGSIEGGRAPNEDAVAAWRAGDGGEIGGAIAVADGVSRSLFGELGARAFVEAAINAAIGWCRAATTEPGGSADELLLLWDRELRIELQEAQRSLGESRDRIVARVTAAGLARSDSMGEVWLGALDRSDVMASTLVFAAYVNGQCVTGGIGNGLIARGEWAGDLTTEWWPDPEARLADYCSPRFLPAKLTYARVFPAQGVGGVLLASDGIVSPKLLYRAMGAGSDEAHFDVAREVLALPKTLLGPWEDNVSLAWIGWGRGNGV